MEDDRICMGNTERCVPSAELASDDVIYLGVEGFGQVLFTGGVLVLDAHRALAVRTEKERDVSS